MALPVDQFKSSSRLEINGLHVNPGRCNEFHHTLPNLIINSFISKNLINLDPQFLKTPIEKEKCLQKEKMCQGLQNIPFVKEMVGAHEKNISHYLHQLNSQWSLI